MAKYNENFIGQAGDKFMLECANLTVIGQGTGTLPQMLMFELTNYHKSKLPYMDENKEVKITNMRTGQSIYLGAWTGNINRQSGNIKVCLTTMFELLKDAVR